MKYRIKQCGEDIFIPQYQFLGFWCKWNLHHDETGSWGTVTFYSLEKAKQFLDKEVKTDIKNKEMKNIQYHKYP